jgi:hypothetical protein
VKVILTDVERAVIARSLENMVGLIQLAVAGGSRLVSDSATGELRQRLAVAKHLLKERRAFRDVDYDLLRTQESRP